jgi:ABC-type uncharacterized transport system permease subunit
MRNAVAIGLILALLSVDVAALCGLFEPGTQRQLVLGSLAGISLVCVFARKT